ncbi:hypothetical protein C8R48DRAFT_676965 [Suillus tomentosus]|nr:hypothetical protein C8R48DRAFT_676965 [Suillus tomentosus]
MTQPRVRREEKGAVSSITRPSGGYCYKLVTDTTLSETAMHLEGEDGHHGESGESGLQWRRVGRGNVSSRDAGGPTEYILEVDGWAEWIRVGRDACTHMTRMGRGQLPERNGPDTRVSRMNWCPGQTGGPSPGTREEWAGYTGWPDELVPRTHGWAEARYRSGMGRPPDTRVGRMNGCPRANGWAEASHQIGISRINWYPGQTGGPRLGTGGKRVGRGYSGWAGYTGWPDEWVPRANIWAEGSRWAGYTVWPDILVPRQTGGPRVVDGPDIWFGWTDVCTPGKRVGRRNVYAQPTQMGQGWFPNRNGPGALKGNGCVGYTERKKRYIGGESDQKEYYDTGHPVKAIIW